MSTEGRLSDLRTFPMQMLGRDFILRCYESENFKANSFRKQSVLPLSSHFLSCNQCFHADFCTTRKSGVLPARGFHRYDVGAKQRNLKENLNAYEEKGIQLTFNEDPFVVVIVTPIMQRAHDLKFSSEIVFVDSTLSCDPENHSITFRLCPCAAGAVPLAVIITKGQTQEAYQKGFELVEIALKKPFNGEGYPAVFMTDDSDAKINALV
ncbi:hypothetical protein AVEN_77738-1 [Araneus ventricosus]|uniref:MULE transposase domain-containing protein n=1 Tax=Araneus ventricosus TaxID=182803 RepID=A0A4Y2SGL0_ARAVE|nr:hypothetical protein AVEN_77738-1 [Araneus ventricosus]